MAISEAVNILGNRSVAVLAQKEGMLFSVTLSTKRVLLSRNEQAKCSLDSCVPELAGLSLVAAACMKRLDDDSWIQCAVSRMHVALLK